MLQTNVLEFLVSGRLDGVTPNAPFQRADAVVPRPTPPGTDPENIYQFEVENLGVIDLTFPALAERLDGPVALGNRYIPWIFIDTGGVPGGLDAAINVAGFNPAIPGPILQKPAQSLTGATGVYLRRCIFVPHGSTLQLAGDIEALPGVPILVRLAVLLPQTRTEEELIVQACCCLDEFGPNIPACENPPEPESVNPDPIPEQALPGIVQVLGQNFQDGDQVSFIPQFPGDPLQVNSTTFVDSTQLNVELIPDVSGTYTVVVTRPSETDCEGTASVEVVLG